MYTYENEIKFRGKKYWIIASYTGHPQEIEDLNLQVFTMDDEDKKMDKSTEVWKYINYNIDLWISDEFEEYRKEYA